MTCLVLLYQFGNEEPCESPPVDLAVRWIEPYTFRLPRLRQSIVLFGIVPGCTHNQVCCRAGGRVQVDMSHHTPCRFDVLGLGIPLCCHMRDPPYLVIHPRDLLLVEFSTRSCWRISCTCCWACFKAAWSPDVADSCIWVLRSKFKR